MVVIGGGIAGLATAIWLADFGHDVTVLERRDRAGGQVTTPAPTPMTVTLPAALRDLFGKTGRRLDREVTLVPADPATRYVTPYGTVTFPHASRSGTLAALRSAFGDDAAHQWDLLMRTAADIWQTLRPVFVERAATVNSITSLALTRRSRHAASDTLTTLLRRADVTHPAIRAIVAAHAYAVGADPEHGPASVVTRPYLHQTFGLWGIDGGPQRLVEALTQRAIELGTVIRTGTVATRIEFDRRRVAAVHIDNGARLVADAVVSTVPDAEHRHLLDRPSRTSSSGRAVCSIRVPATRDPRTACDAGQKARTMITPDDDVPFSTIDVTPDEEVIAHVAIDRSADLDSRAAARILAALAARDPSGPIAAYAAHRVHPRTHAGGAPDFDFHDLDIYGPDQWSADLALGNGSPHGAPTAGRWALTRLPRPRTSIHGLYRAGAATQPVPGIDAATLSSAVVADLIGRSR